MDTFKTKNNLDVKITFIKHGSLMINFNEVIIQIDPVSEYANYKEFPKADLILITHEHSDHFDKKAIRELKKSNTKIILNENAEKLLGEGIIMKNGDVISIGKDFEIDAVPAYNTTADRIKYHPNGRDNGYVLTLDGLRIYISGDAEDIPEMKNLKNIDIAFLSVNQPYTMTPKQAANAAKIVNSPIVYPYHYGNTDIKKLVELLKGDKKIEVRIREMQ